MTNETALGGRLSFIKLDAAARARIRTLKPTIMAAQPAALDDFYLQVQAYPHTKAFFADQKLIDSAKGRQQSHWTGYPAASSARTICAR